MLYLDHFGLHEPPFRITPHTDFFFEEAERGATLAALVYAILHDEGIVRVSGEVGSGKTMLCRVLMERLPDHVSTIYLSNPSLPREEILRAIADDLDLSISDDRMSVALRELQDHLIRLYAEGRRVVVLIDEAHAMPDETLEQVRLFSNLESNRHKLLQIVLFGQPELDETLDKPSMRQLKDRITHSFRMRPLSPDEIARYLTFRMRAAGYRGPDVFTAAAATAISKASSGLTRRVNILADKALLAAFADGAHAVTIKQARTAIRDSDFGRLLNTRRSQPRLLLVAGISLLVVGLAAGFGIQRALTAADPAGTPPRSRVDLTQPTNPLEPSSPQVASGSTEILPTAAAASAGSPATEATDKPAALVVPENSPRKALPTEAQKRFANFAAGSNELLQARLADAQERAQRESDGSYSIELFSTANIDQARLERFLARAKDLVSVDEILVFPLAKGNKHRIRVTYGSFPDKLAAVQAAESLPKKYRQSFGLEPRSFGELRSEL